MNQYHVYIIECSDGSYYTGVTNNLERRLKEHNFGENSKSYTHNRRPVKLVFEYSFIDIIQAIEFEKQVKGWNRAKKKAIIDGSWEDLKELATCKNQSSHKNLEE